MAIPHFPPSTIAGVLLMAAGVAFLVVAAIGLVRLPDALQRMHSATKAGTLGTALIILGAMLLGEVARPQTGLLTIIFLLITLPFGAQLLGRATYIARTPLDRIVDDPLEREEQLAKILLPLALLDQMGHSVRQSD